MTPPPPPPPPPPSPPPPLPLPLPLLPAKKSHPSPYQPFSHRLSFPPKKSHLFLLPSCHPFFSSQLKNLTPFSYPPSILPSFHPSLLPSLAPLSTHSLLSSLPPAPTSCQPQPLLQALNYHHTLPSTVLFNKDAHGEAGRDVHVCVFLSVPSSKTENT